MTATNKWFDILKQCQWFIEYGFSQLREINEEGEGELVCFPGQLDRILNTDGSMSGGRPMIEYSATDKFLPKRATSTHKSGYAATLIARSTIVGWPIPPHFQIKIDAREENKGMKNNSSEIWRQYIDGMVLDQSLNRVQQ